MNLRMHGWEDDQEDLLAANLMDLATERQYRRVLFPVLEQGQKV